MTRGQRRAHFVLWLVLGPLVVGALVHRADVPPSELPGSEAAP